MTPSQLIKTIYLGDRFCLSIRIEGERNRVLLQVDCISRVRGDSWSFNDAEDVHEGFLVFENVSRYHWDVRGALPNAWIEPVSVTQLADTANAWECVFS